MIKMKIDCIATDKTFTDLFRLVWQVKIFQQCFLKVHDTKRKGMILNDYQ